MIIIPGMGNQTDVWTYNLKERIIHCVGEIEEDMAESIIAQLLYLSSEGNGDIQLFINSPGGDIDAGMAIYDTMNYIKPDVATICVGRACSMGSILLSGGTKGKRYILPHGKVLIHQALGGCAGQSSDVDIAATELRKAKEMLNRILSENCGRPYEDVVRDTDRDYWMQGQEAIDYGIVDKILVK
ncbi:MAG: ATP-dependent Clp protease proteolytic subunit [Treponema sp.]|nr:ATP-dependent Clp protease proteolytic subunit [Treponema sp.]